MKRILFVALNSSWSQSNLALYYLREIVCDLGFNQQMCAFTLKEPLHQIMEDIYGRKPDIICFSAYIWNKIYWLSMQIELAKVLPECVFVVGGPEAQAFKSAVNTKVILGAGEARFRYLAKHNFDLAADLSEIPPIPLKDIPFPYQISDKEVLQNHLIYYECYRGCPYSCVYCLSAGDNRHEMRFDVQDENSLIKLNRELRLLAKLKPKTLKFIDRSFNVQKQIAHAIWDFAIKGDFDFDFHFEIYPDLLDEQDIQKLSKAPPGRIRFEIGIQSTNEYVLRQCGRISSWSKTCEALKELKARTQVRIHADLIAGLPNEDFSSVIRSLNELCACEPDAVQLGMLKILPDTPMLKIASDLGYLWMDQPPYQVLASDALSFNELNVLQDYAHLLSLYWNKEEHPQLWHQLLQKNPANVILEKLRHLHIIKQIPLHSVARQKRESMMQELLQNLSCYD
ncbi:MAG: DUF4080 domain-containing protein [Candidatus Cloacimonetes bacterium]|nr:DUF4080 domain-containing protein [Candidatus Cloacimonadota bacterium]